MGGELSARPQGVSSGKWPPAAARDRLQKRVNPPPRRRRLWLILATLVALVGLAIAGVIWSLQHQATHVLARQDRLVKEAFVAIRARPTGHPCLFPPSLAGDGWPDYVKALAGLAAMPDPESNELPAHRGEPEFRPDPEKLEEIFQKYGPWVVRLIESSRKSEFVPKYEYERGSAMELPNITQAIFTSKYLSEHASFVIERGEPGLALDSLALGIAVGDDTGRSGVLVNFLVQLVCEGIEIAAAREQLAEHSFEPRELEAFASKLDRLWEARPTVFDAMLAENSLVRRSLVDLGKGEMGARYTGSHHHSWRYLFSERLEVAAALAELESHYREMGMLSRVPSHLRENSALPIQHDGISSKNAFVADLFPAMARVFRRDNVTQMEWTLMRVAVALAWFEGEHGAMPGRLDELVPRYLPRVPLCPLTGKPLGYRDGKVWSFGRNGVDDGGVPGKNNDSDDEDGDVVWSVRRE